MTLEQILDLLTNLTEPQTIKTDTCEFIVRSDTMGFAFLDETHKVAHSDGLPVDGQIIRAQSLTAAVEVFQWLLAGKPEAVA